MHLMQLVRCEIRAFSGNISVLLVVFGGVIFYSFLYPLPYAWQIPREQKVVVVNLDGSQFSRQLERMVDATPQVRISDREGSIAAARERFFSGGAAGVLLIPENFHRDLLQGKRPTLAFAGDAGLFLVYGTVLEGMSSAAGTLAAQVKISRMIMSGQPPRLAEERHSAIRLNLLPVFNASMGYVNYVIPAVFVLILHQTMILATGMLGSGQKEDGDRSPSLYVWGSPPGWLVLIRSGLFVIVYGLLSLYYFGFCYDWYGIPHQAGMAGLLLVILPFLLAAALLGICLGAILPRQELVVLLVLLSSMVLIFVSGFIWPEMSLPRPLVLVLQLVPALPAIKALLGLNHLGCSFADILPQVVQLWFCAGLYGVLAWFLMGRIVETGRDAARGPEK